MILQSKLPIFNFVLQRKIAEENKARNNNVFFFIDWTTLEFFIMKQWKLTKSRIFQFVAYKTMYKIPVQVVAQQLPNSKKLT